MLDRDSRELLYEMAITTRENADAEPSVSGAHICPGLLGGMDADRSAHFPFLDCLEHGYKKLMRRHDPATLCFAG
jgi:hypothetical protein